MSLRVLELEHRDNPSVLQSHGEWVDLINGKSIRPYDNFDKPSHTAGYGDIVAIGAAETGGPRVQVLKVSETGSPEKLADFFAFEPTFHGGVPVSTDGHYVVAGAGNGGGPVAAVYDLNGKEVSRFFAFEDSFRGGVDVQIYDGVIYVSAGKGGGPVVATFDVHGNSLGAFYGGPVDGRTGYDLLVAPDLAGVTTVNLIEPNGTMHVNYPGLGRYETHLPAGFTQAGYSGSAITFGGNGYLTGAGVDLGFRELAPLYHFDDHAAGNPNPPPTTGFRMGVYFADSPQSDANADTTTATVINLTGESVGSNAVGTGTLYAPMQGPDGTMYAVTASHVVDMTNALIAPGPADGPQLINYGYPTIATFFRTGPYSVDAAAVPTILPLNPGIYFDGTYYPIDGIATPQVGQAVIAVGRGHEPGVGIFEGPQAGSVNVNTGYLGGAELSGQLVVGPSAVGVLARPGFSGGPAFTVTVDSTGIHRWLVGMVIAGNGSVTYVTANADIENALGLKAQLN